MTTTERTYSDEVLLAAYARLRAEGDEAGCRRIREIAQHQASGVHPFAERSRVFADPPAKPINRRQQPTAPNNPLLATPLDQIGEMDKLTYFAHRRALQGKTLDQYRQRLRERPEGTPRPEHESSWESHLANNRIAYAPDPTVTKAVRMANRYRDVARRRRVLAAIRHESEFASGLGGHHLPDSEPVDVLFIHDPTGKPITDPQHIRQTLNVRAAAVERLKDPSIDDAQRAFLQKVLATPAHGFEVKSLLKTSRDYAQMNPRALAAKKRWSERYGIAVHTAVVDARRGSKFSGHKLHIAPGTVAPTIALASMHKVSDPNAALKLVSGESSNPTG